MHALSIFLLIFNLISSDQVQANCQLSKNDIEATQRIFAYEDPQTHSLQLQHNEIVRSQLTLKMICNNLDIKNSKCQANKRFTQSFPMQDCDNPIKALVQEIPDNVCSATLYRVGYAVNNDFLELYRSCYDAKKVHILYTIHDVHAHNLGTNRPTQTFTTDGIISGALAATFSNPKIYDRFITLFGKKQSYMPTARSNTFNRGHLVPSNDYLFMDHMRNTFKYVNVVPQFGSINRGNWVIIENWIRRYAPFKVCTGTVGVLSLRDENNNVMPVYLATNSRNPVPQWLYKILNNGNDKYVFLVYNSIFSDQVLTSHCQIEECPKTLKLNTDKESGLTFCCDHEHFISKVVPHLSGVC